LLETSHGHVLALNDPRRFGSLDLVRSDIWTSHAPFTRMGPEPLGPDFDARRLAHALKGKGTSIKAALLDQRVVAGLGNIYVCEALNMAGIAPTRAAGKISGARLALLVDAIRTVLTAAIVAGGSTLRDYARPNGELGYFSKQWRVYGREGESCPCGGAVERRVDGGRSTFYCRKCQK
jgi:formamidopyrimidine-DNA glycosylase